jgi:hypothetical protein
MLKRFSEITAGLFKTGAINRSTTPPFLEWNLTVTHQRDKSG